MDYQPFVPTGSLANHLEVLFHLDAYNPSHGKERLVPDGAISLVVELDGQERKVYDDEGKFTQTCKSSWISGVRSTHLSFDTPPGTRLMAARFLPGQAAAILGTPIDRLNNQVISASELWGDEIEATRDRLLATDDVANRLALLAEFLSARIDEDAATPLVVDKAVRAICDAPTLGRLDDIVSKSGVSRKHLANLFKRYVGPTPKLFQRIRRFAEVVRLLQAESGDIAWAEVSAECGYFDQAHFIRDFRKFSGHRPSPFVVRMGDRQNFFPDEDG